MSGSGFAERLAEAARGLGGIRDEDLAIATAPKDAVWRQGKVTLFRFRPLARPAVRVPVLICYGLIGRYTMADLAEDRSLVRGLLTLGIDLYVLDWGEPGRADRFATLDDYVTGYLGDAVAHVAQARRQDKVNLLGICAGGTFATTFTALHPDAVNALVLANTPVDFHADPDGAGLLGLWIRSLPLEEVDRLVDAHGNLPGELMGDVFSRLAPTRTLARYGRELDDTLADRDKLLFFLRMERWLADRPDHPGEAARQWLKDLYRDNKLVRNELVLGDRLVDLRRITCPVLNITADGDTVVPPESARALGGLVGTTDSTELSLPGGHLGPFVGGKARGVLAQAVAEWLAARDGAAAPPPRAQRKRGGARPVPV